MLIIEKDMFEEVKAFVEYRQMYKMTMSDWIKKHPEQDWFLTFDDAANRAFGRNKDGDHPSPPLS